MGLAKELSSLALILPRYGASLGGGAETLAQKLVEQLITPRGQRYLSVQKIEVWTTCAVDHRTRENALPPGATEENGILVRRFPVDERDLECFIRCEHAIHEGVRLSADQQLDWLQSSVNSQSLYQHIARAGGDFDVLLFAPYLFATTFWGALIHPERSLLIPCLHDERYAYLGVMSYLFKSVRGLIFNAPAEQRLACELYGAEWVNPKAQVVGMGFEPKQASSQAPSQTQSVAQPSLPPELPAHYLLYVGRKERGKNLDLLIRYFQAYRALNPTTELHLAIIGSGEIDFLEELPPGVVDVGFVSEELKQRLIENAIALCQPSKNESFSIVLMEAWLAETPVLVHAESEVTREHVTRSGGGLYFSSAEEFAAVVKELIASPELSRRLALAGKRYVEQVYSWEAVLSRFVEALTVCGLLDVETDSLAKEHEYEEASCC